MVNHGYTVKDTTDVVVNRNLIAIQEALDKIAGAVFVPTFYTFVTVGNNGGGRVALIPPKLADGTSPLYRALIGMQLVAAIDLTNAVNLQTSFEQMLSANDQIRQIDSSNLSARTIAFVLQG